MIQIKLIVGGCNLRKISRKIHWLIFFIFFFQGRCSAVISRKRSRFRRIPIIWRIHGSRDKNRNGFQGLLWLVITLLRSVWQYGLWNFLAGGTKLERFLPKNQHIQRKSLSFENLTNKEVSKIEHNFSNKMI